jgi:hypothetical protein
MKNRGRLRYGRLWCPAALCLLALPFVLFAAGDRLQGQDRGGFSSLFDGKTLAGWEGNTEIFRVEKGAIVAGSLKQKIDHNEFLCTTKSYRDFELRLQARLQGEGHNAGIQFRSQRIENHHEVKGYQCDIGAMGAAADHLIWGALYDESRRRIFLLEPDQNKLREVVDPNGWNKFVIRCEGPRIQIWVNGLKAIDYTEQEAGIAAEGIIGLQIHGGAPAQACYRRIKIKPL